MKKKFRRYVLCLVGALVLLAMPALAADGKVAEGQAKKSVESAAPVQDSKAVEGQATVPAATAAPAKEAQEVDRQAEKCAEGAAQAKEGKADKPAEGQAKEPGAAPGQAYKGKVVDAKTKEPIAGALITLGDKFVRTDQEGAFHLEGTGETLKLRAPGYARQELAISQLGNPQTDIALTPLKVKALYLTVYGVSSKKIREAALEAIALNQMNALVIDIKGDRGFIPFKVDIPLAEEIGAQKTILIKDMPALMASLKEKGLYLIARIVVFKDDPLAAAKPQWAVRTKGGGAFRDREKLRWVDPFRREVWDYNIAIAKVAAKLGFDEVQFDYVRFPDNRGTGFSKPANQDSRTEAITGFLEAAYQALIPYNVMVAADIFGYVCWNTNDTDIGQKIDRAVQAVDVVCPMLYPSGYQFGIPNYRNPVKNPYEIVYLSLKRAQERTNANPRRFRPWLQAFRDYAFRGGDFKEDRMRIQIQAADKFGASGWMFWNPRNIYPTGKFLN